MRGQFTYNVRFMGKWVVYLTVIGDGCYMSTHNRTGLSDQQARGYFKREHAIEVNTLLAQKRQRTEMNKA